MAIIDHQILDCSIFLYPTLEAAQHGDAFGGSGFLVNVRNEPHNHIYAVTNKHVAMTRGNSVIRLNRLDGTPEYFALEPHEWTGHPRHDLAVVRLSLDREVHRFATFPVTAFLDPPSIDHYSIGVGDDIFMIGRFVDDRGKQTNRPMARFGNLMITPEQPIMVNVEGGRQQAAGSRQQAAGSKRVS